MSRLRKPGRTSPRRRTAAVLRAAVLFPLILAAGLAVLASCSFDLDYDKYAIVYGISDYPPAGNSPPNNDLYSTDDDARDVASLLTSQGFQVILRVTDHGTGEKDANAAQLVDDFNTAATAANLDSGDLFLFFYSGHGDQVSQLPGTSEDSPGSDAQDEALVLVDAAVANIVTLRDDELAELIRTIPCARRVVILDACFSGGFVSNPLDAQAIPPDYSDGSYGIFEILGNAFYLYANFQDFGSDIPPGEALVIAASGEQDFAYESGGNGVMTTYLLESAANGDRNRDGFVTVSESYYYIYRNIDENFNAVAWPYSDVFFPHTSGGPVDYILFTK